MFFNHKRGFKMTQTKTISHADLSQFTGTSRYYRQPLYPKDVVYTDGLQFLAEQAGAYWLLDLIAFYQLDERIKNDDALQGIQFWHLRVQDKAGILVCERDKDDVVLTHTLDYTDFPLDAVTIYVANGVIHLPSEY
jgi:hypothetical protein